MKLRPLSANEVYIAVPDSEEKGLREHRANPSIRNSKTLSAVFEPVNATSRVLVFYAQGNRMSLERRVDVKKLNVETGDISLAWDITSVAS